MLIICELVVEKGVDVAAMSDDGITALIAAASEGHAGIVELLLGKAQADPDAKDKVKTKNLEPKMTAQIGLLPITYFETGRSEVILVLNYILLHDGPLPDSRRKGSGCNRWE